MKKFVNATFILLSVCALVFAGIPFAETEGNAEVPGWTGTGDATLDLAESILNGGLVKKMDDEAETNGSDYGFLWLDRTISTYQSSFQYVSEGSSYICHEAYNPPYRTTPLTDSHSETKKLTVTGNVGGSVEVESVLTLQAGFSIGTEISYTDSATAIVNPGETARFRLTNKNNEYCSSYKMEHQELTIHGYQTTSTWTQIYSISVPFFSLTVE